MLSIELLKNDIGPLVVSRVLQFPKVLGESASGFDERDAPIKLLTRDLVYSGATWGLDQKICIGKVDSDFTLSRRSIDKEIGHFNLSSHLSEMITVHTSLSLMSTWQHV
jgi:hypothetical protein